MYGNDFVEAIAQRVADIVMQRIEPMLVKECDLVPRQELKDRLHVSDKTLWAWEREGKITRFGTFGRKVYYKMSEIENQLKNN